MKMFFLAVLSLIISLTACSLKGNIDNEISFLSTDGHYVINENRDTILLRGVGLGNWLLPEGYMWHFGSDGDRPRKIEKLIRDLTDSAYADEFWKKFRNDFITEADIQKISEMGLNSVRPALNARVFMTEGDTAVFIEENFKLLDSLAAWCGKYGIYIILDMHGAPGGQTGQNIDDSPNNLPELFMDSKYEERLTRLWVKIAERYKDNPVIAGYDLLNEPLPRRTGAADKYGHMLEQMYKRLTKAIRAVDKKHMIFLAGADWSNDWSVFTEPFDDNSVYQFHYYCWDTPGHLINIDYFLRYRDALNVPVWVGETGEKNAVIYWGTTQYFEKNNIGWSFWPWKKLDTHNGICSINRPGEWEKISDYSRGGDKPSKEDAKLILNEFLENIKFENCTFLTDISNSILRQIPGTVEAVNYGHDGYMKSFYVSDTSFRSEYYRKNEPVKVELIDYNEKARIVRQNVVLNEGEWIVYNINSPDSQNYNCNMMVKPENDISKILISLNDRIKEISLNSSKWSNTKINDLIFKKGVNRFKVFVEAGSAKIEKFDFSFK